MRIGSVSRLRPRETNGQLARYVAGNRVGQPNWAVERGSSPIAEPTETVEGHGRHAHPGFTSRTSRINRPLWRRNRDVRGQCQSQIQEVMAIQQWNEPTQGRETDSSLGNLGCDLYACAYESAEFVGFGGKTSHNPVHHRK